MNYDSININKHMELSLRLQIRVFTIQVFNLGVQKCTLSILKTLLPFLSL